MILYITKWSLYVIISVRHECFIRITRAYITIVSQNTNICLKLTAVRIIGSSKWSLLVYEIEGPHYGMWWCLMFNNVTHSTLAVVIICLSYFRFLNIIHVTLHMCYQMTTSSVLLLCRCQDHTQLCHIVSNPTTTYRRRTPTNIWSSATHVANGFVYWINFFYLCTLTDLSIFG